MSPVTCHLSRVTCHLSHVTCHLSHVKKKKITFFLFKKIYISIYTLTKIGKIGGASWWRVCYQRGLPRLVYEYPEGVLLMIGLFTPAQNTLEGVLLKLRLYFGS